MGLSLELQQKQVISQKMMQSVQMLQMTGQELSEYVNEIAMENPVIDLKAPPTIDNKSFEEQRILNSFKEERIYLRQRQNDDNDVDSVENWNMDTKDGETLQEFLWSQLASENFDEAEYGIAQYILECIDPNGYLTETTADLSKLLGTSDESIHKCLTAIQKLDPAGVGARDLSECLLLQLLRINGGEVDPILARLITEDLENVARNRIPFLEKKYGISTAEILDYFRQIKELDPKPGKYFSNRERLQHVIPDVVVVKFADHFDAVLNDRMYPNVQINSYYSKLASEDNTEEVKTYLNEKLKQAQWVQECIVQRGRTIMRVTDAIMRYQSEFFEYGIGHLKPMQQSDIADDLNVHVSTVSRAINNKYLQCSYGVFPFKYFFAKGMTSSQISSASSISSLSSPEDGISTDAIKSYIQEIVDSEDKKKPYSDRIIGEKLAERGIEISRRTVAKYREQLGIPGTSGRKNYGT